MKRDPIRTHSLQQELAATRWGSQLTPEQLARVAAEATECTVPAGAYVCRKGEAADAWLGVLEGFVKMMVSTADGKTSTFTGIPAGGWFGEGSLLKTEPRRYDIVALRASRIVRVPRRTFEWLLNTSIPFNRFLLVQLNERLGQFIGMLETQRLMGPDERVARCVAQLFNPILHPGIERKLEVSQEEIGYLAGISRQRVNQSLQRLQRAGLLRVEYGAIVIEDLEGLRSYGSPR
ncbi:MAG: Crp/Fnr family transcriptional regulator [Sutterellaceae bacterium]|nr:Crp/Fnr family transcriptional regulator [Burkholderiaceae bacterium]MDW8430327.1 Crp/Fnr family transcriptional regulator [Sutterellaceae bacterium]